MVNSLLLSLVLLSALYLVAYQLRELLIGFGLVVPLLVCLWWASSSFNLALVYLFNVLYVTFVCYISFFIARFLFESRHISRDMLLAAICLYLLLGLLWAFIFQLIELRLPGSFSLTHGVPGNYEEAMMMLGELKYFSYVTLSTLGYGDITPLTRAARNWAVAEALLGQVYMAFVIARLIGLSISRDD